jgi:hypothetical protein
LSRDPITDDASASCIEPLDVWWELLRGQRLALIRGTAQSGKTSCIARGAYYSAQNLLGGYHLHLAGSDGAAALNLVEKHKGDAHAVIVFDESQWWFNSVDESKQTVLQVLLKNSGTKCRAFFFTTTEVGDHKLAHMTPKELEDVQHWFAAPSVESADVERYVGRVLGAMVDARTMEEDVAAELKRSLFRFCGNHVGVLTAILLHLKDHDTVTPTAAFGCRVLCGGNGPLSAIQEKLLQQLLATGAVDINFATAHEDVKQLIRYGQLTPSCVFTTTSGKALSIFKSTETMPFTFTHAFQAERLRTTLVPPATRADHTPTSAREVFMKALPMMPAVAFLSATAANNPRRTTTSTKLSEAPLQHGFSYALIRADIPYSPERSIATGLPGRAPAVDFVARLPNTTSAIEFLADSSERADSLKVHADRFAVGGAYAKYHDYLVVSFQLMDSVPTKESVAIKNTCVVSPHRVFGWNIFVVRFSGEEALHVHRNGVPVNAKGKVVREHIAPLPATLWVKQQGSGGSAFSVSIPTTGQQNVDCLKDAIKVKMGTDYTGNAANLTVSKHGAEEAATGGAALETNTEQTPYVFEAPSTSKLTVTVTDGKGVVFRVVPEQHLVMDLKKAIKEAGAIDVLCGFTRIIIKHPATGKVLGDAEALHAGVKYVYELP